MDKEEMPGLIQHEEYLQEEYLKERKQHALSLHDINIKFLSRGCVITVGCRSIPFTTINQGMNALREYVNSPIESRKAWEEVLRVSE